jgi:hypothetical protein
MSNKNDVTGDLIITKASETYRSNYDFIFRKKEAVESHKAFWECLIYSSCPNCGSDVNLNGDETFEVVVKNKLNYGESNTERSKDIDCTCHKCNHTFKAELTV